MIQIKVAEAVLSSHDVTQFRAKVQPDQENPDIHPTPLIQK